MKLIRIEPDEIMAELEAESQPTRPYTACLNQDLETLEEIDAHLSEGDIASAQVLISHWLDELREQL